MKKFKFFVGLLSLIVISMWTLSASNSVQAFPQAQSETFSCTNVIEIPQNECEALIAFYESTNGRNWGDNRGWLTSNTPCQWLGVVCDDNHVTELYPGFFYSRNTGNNLSGPIPSEIGNLSNLSQLWLPSNQLSSLPSEIGNLSNLTILNLYDNYLISSLPPEIGNLSNLTDLNLYNNNLISLPPEIGNLSNLTDLDLSRNNLTSLPTEIGSLENLANLSLWGNSQT